jgi:hypothetical protein
MRVDTFNTQTYDGMPIELVVGENEATFYVDGIVRYKVSLKLPKYEAFQLYHKISVITYDELRTQYTWE